MSNGFREKLFLALKETGIQQFIIQVWHDWWQASVTFHTVKQQQQKSKPNYIWLL